MLHHRIAINICSYIHNGVFNKCIQLIGFIFVMFIIINGTQFKFIITYCIICYLLLIIQYKCIVTQPMSQLAYQLKKGFADQASDHKFLALLNSAHRIESVKDKQIVPSIPLSAFTPSQLPYIHKQKIKLKNRSVSQAKLKPIKQIKKQTNRNIPSISQQQGLQGKTISNKKQRAQSSQSLRRIKINPSTHKKSILFNSHQKQQKHNIIDTTAAKSTNNLTKLSNNITFQQIKGEKGVLLLNLKFGKIQQNLSYKMFIKKQMVPPGLEIIIKLNRWVSRFQIKSGLIQTLYLQQIFQKKVISNNLILTQFSNYVQLRQQYIDRIPGLKYYDQKHQKRGFNLAAAKIQSLFKMNFDLKYTKKLKSLMNKVKVIQKQWRVSLAYRRANQQIMQRINQRIQSVHKLNKDLIKNWQLIKNSPRFQIHICSISLEEFKRLSIQKLREKQNTQLTRIFRAADPNISIIYVTPFQLGAEVIKYYQRILKMNSQLSQIRNRLFFVDLQQYANKEMFQYLTTASLLYYSSKSLKKIKQILSTNQQGILNFNSAYIVPSHPSNQYINIGAQLGIPILSSSQSTAKLYSTKSGYHQLFRPIMTDKIPFKLLKTVQNLYSQKQVIKSLAVLIYKHKQVEKWYLKIDDEIQSRGLAVLNVNSLTFLRQLRRTEEQELSDKQIIKLIVSQLSVKLKNRLKILNKGVYHNYQQYISHFTTRGGIIEASPLNKSQQHSISFFIEPNGDFSIISTYSRLQLGGKTVNSGIKCPSDLSTNQVDSQKIVLNLYRVLWGRHKYFGYFTADFLYDQKKSEIYMIGLDCFLNAKTSSLFIPSLISFGHYNKQINSLQSKDPLKQTECKKLHYLYYPMLILQDLPSIPKFFKNCKFQNISFDLEHKIGTVFLLMGDIQNGCLGFITISESLTGLLQEVQRLVSFLSRDYRPIKKGTDELGQLRGVLINWIRKIKKTIPYKQDINLSLIF